MKTNPLLWTSLIAALLPTLASAATRASARYSMTTEIVDAGGRKATSASYANDGSIGGFGGISTAAAPEETAKHGYVGQLYDSKVLTVTCNPALLNEGAAGQLSARVDMDDGSILFPTPTSVGWGIIVYPLSSVSGSGQVTAGAVYQNTNGTAQGIFQGMTDPVTIPVFDTNPDNFGTYAGDGLPDSWQVSYFGIGNPNAGPGFDPDGDSQTNGFEYVANTIPTDPNSRFRFRIERVSGQPARKNLIFSPRYGSRNYALFYRTNVASGTWNTLTETSTSDSLLERTVTDLNATNDWRFYRVQISILP